MSIVQTNRPRSKPVRPSPDLFAPLFQLLTGNPKPTPDGLKTLRHKTRTYRRWSRQGREGRPAGFKSWSHGADVTLALSQTMADQLKRVGASE